MALQIVFLPFVTQLNAATQRAATYVTPQMMDLIYAHRGVLARMNAPERDGKQSPFIESDIAPLLTEGWKLAGKWAAAWLDLHPNASTRQLDTIFVDFTPPPPRPKFCDENQPELYAMEGSATRVAPGVYVVTAVYGTKDIDGTSGTFMVISRDSSGLFQPMWDIKPLAEKHYSLKDEIGLWAVLESCAYHCGPMVVDKVLPLPPTEKGLYRFAIDAFQATNGGTMEVQFSVWEWNGKEANPEAIQSYNHVVDQGAVHIRGNLVRIATKEPTNTIAPCGGCPEPRGEWTLLLTPDGTKDLGHRFRTPELQWADRLLTTIAASGDASSMATSDVIDAIRGSISKQRAKYPPSDNATEEERAFVFFGMFDECKVLKRGQTGAFLLKMDDADFSLSYEKREGQPFFTAVQIRLRS
ncbi:MAG: hypothetical protein ABR905_15470 [Terracidiphilus sp.]|jgi:hypothetical protein